MMNNNFLLNVFLVCNDENYDAENDNGSKEIGFHEYHHPNIVLMHNKTIARRTDGDVFYGVCFTNRPLEKGEKIYIRIAESYAHWVGSLIIGLTNTDPANTSLLSIHDLTDNMIKYLDNMADVNDVICITVNYDDTISFSINGSFRYTEKLSNVSVSYPMWLAFDLYGTTRAIEISQNKPKEMHFRGGIFVEIPK